MITNNLFNPLSLLHHQPSQALGDMTASALGSIADAIEIKSGRADVKLLLGPWLETYGALTDTKSGRIDDEAKHKGSLGDKIIGELQGPASHEGTALIGIEAGLARFLKLDLEAVNALGTAYLKGSVDFAKARAELFGDFIFEYPDLSLDGWRLKVGSDDPDLTEDQRAESQLLAIGGRIGVQVLVELIGAHYEAGYDSPPIPIYGQELPIELTARLDAAVHAFARCWVDGRIGTDGLVAEAGGKAFAGASATLAGKATLASLIGAKGSITGWAGAGAEFTYGVTLRHDKVAFENSAGAALGMGVSYSYGVSISPSAIIGTTAFPEHGPNILNQFIDRVADASESMIDGEISPLEFGGEVASASGEAVAGIYATMEDSLPE